MFVDEAVIACAAGNGGKGCHSLDRSNPRAYKPTGGDGGHGGNVIIEASPNIHTLLDFQYKREFWADNGANGGSSFMRGKDAQDIKILVPVGTEVIEAQTGELFKDLDQPGKSVLVCKGGLGGHGNDKKRDAIAGEPGEQKQILLKLKLMADVGLIGFPNAGKSTLISRISHAKSKIGAYPFTTKNPILGVVKFEDSDHLVVADIPGIIEGASQGRGLGIEFLKHTERTRVLLHLIDFAAVDGRDPVSDYRVINAELEQYSPALAKKPQIIVANKMDVPEAKEALKAFKKKIKKEIFPISAITGEGVKPLLNRLRKLVDEKE